MSFEDIEVDLTPTTINRLIEIYVKQQMFPESIDMFETTLERTGDLKEALFAATINDSAVIILCEKMKTEEKNDSKE